MLINCKDSNFLYKKNFLRATLDTGNKLWERVKKLQNEEK